MNFYLGVCNAAKKVSVSRPKPLWSVVELDAQSRCFGARRRVRLVGRHRQRFSRTLAHALKNVRALLMRQRRIFQYPVPA